MFRNIFRRESSESSRQRQIKTLRVYNKDVRQISSDHFSVAFEVAGAEYQLSVFLSGGYPEERPLLRLSPAMSHPWLDPNQVVVGAPGIVNYTKHCDLGQLVKNIVHELERCLAGGTPASSALGSGVHQISGFLSSQASPRVPQYEAEYPELNSLSNEQLQQLLEDDDLLDELVDRLPSINSLHAELHNSMLRCQQIASSTLEDESVLTELRSNTDNLEKSVATELQRFDSLQLRSDQLSERYSPAFLCQLLRIAAADCEQSADACIQRLKDGHFSVEEFVKQFLELRTLYGVRKAKQDRLANQLVELGDHSSL